MVEIFAFIELEQNWAFFKGIDAMGKPVFSLIEALGLETRDHLALVGGGGKTSLMFALAKILTQTGNGVLTTTTTKIGHNEAKAAPSLVFQEVDLGWRDAVDKCMRVSGYVFLGQNIVESTKVQGIDPGIADDLYHNRNINYLIVEADGSARRPLKAPAEHEPVIPDSVTKVVALLGLEALGRKLTPEVGFRIELIEKLTGLRQNQKIKPKHLSMIISEPQGLFKGAPNSSKRIVFLNKMDLLKERAPATDLAKLIIKEAPDVERVVVGSIREGEYIVYQ